jgi:hypothetical protein
LLTSSRSWSAPRVGGSTGKSCVPMAESSERQQIHQKEQSHVQANHPRYRSLGKRPFRVHVDPSQDGAEVVNAVADRMRREMYRNIGLVDLLSPRSNS